MAEMNEENGAPDVRDVRDRRDRRDHGEGSDADLLGAQRRGPRRRLWAAEHPPRLVGVELWLARRAQLEPLFRWIHEHGANQRRVLMLAYRRKTGYGCTASKAYQIRIGKAPAPGWLVDECCAVLGVSRETVYAAADASAAAAVPAQNVSVERQSGQSGQSGWDVA